jgi:uncharacterized protein YhbP (UPF0306 family)
VHYTHEGLTLYFASDAASQKAGNIARNPKVSAAIANKTDNFYKLQGLSLSGFAHRIQDQSEADRISLALFRRMPQSRRFVPREQQSLALFAITPVAISLVDYAQGNGRSFLLEL